VGSSPTYDRERAKRYKKWWARQKGSPQGELIQVEPEKWQRKKAKPEEMIPARGADTAEG